VAGLWLLSIREDFSVGLGDGLVMLCAVAFACHIMVIDRFAPKTDGIKMSCIQFLVCAALCVPGMLIFETVSLSAFRDAWLPIVYAGLMSSGVGYTLQIIAQKDTEPALASLIMSLESVFAALSGAVLLGERLSAREGVGCGLMFAAVIVAQLPDLIKARRAKT
jgi:drug/metabolite transporter (DMT)-like permease